MREKHVIYPSGSDIIRLIGSSPPFSQKKREMSLFPFCGRQIFHCIDVPVPHLLNPFLLVFKYCCDVLTWRLLGKYPRVVYLGYYYFFNGHNFDQRKI